MASDDASASSSLKMVMVENLEEETAIVSNFPYDVIENIISFLPLKKAYGCSLLSKTLCNSWKFSRDLSFNIDYRNLADPADIFKLIQFVMDEHRGPVIERLKVILDPTGRENQVRDWIQKAVAKGVQELDLDFSAGNSMFLIPSDILDGARLQVLKVCYCDIGSLKEFHCLRYLKKISVEDVHVPRNLLDAVLSNCLLLENLEMTNCYIEGHLAIQARTLKNFKSLKVVDCGNLFSLCIDGPGLQVLHYIGEICRDIVAKEEMPKIEEVVLQPNPTRSINLFPGVGNLMVALRRTKFLSVSSPIIERLCPKYFEREYRDLNLCFENLREIRLSLGGSTRSGFKQSTSLSPYDIASFLSKSPYIEKLTIDFGMFPMESGPFWEIVAKEQFDNSVASFKFLSSIRFMNFKFFSLEMELASFIMARTEVLKDCLIVKSRRYPGIKQNELDFGHSWDPEKFKTTIYEHNEYKST